MPTEKEKSCLVSAKIAKERSQISRRIWLSLRDGKSRWLSSGGGHSTNNNINLAIYFFSSPIHFHCRIFFHFYHHVRHLNKHIYILGATLSILYSLWYFVIWQTTGKLHFLKRYPFLYYSWIGKSLCTKKKNKKNWVFFFLWSVTVIF